MVFSSTSAIYGVPEQVPIGEDHPQQPINPCSFTKLVVEHMLMDLGASHRLPWMALRYFNAAGSDPDGEIGEAHDPETHLIPLILEAARGGASIQIFGTDYPTPDGTCLRDYVHVDDLSRAHIAAFDTLSAPGTQLFYNLGTGKPTSNREVIRAVEKIVGRPVKVIDQPRRPGDPPALYADSAKARRELNWNVKFGDIESIVATAWKWHSAHPRGYADR